ncbi:MAG: cobalamin-binding protein [Bacteroidota bacterium]
MNTRYPSRIVCLTEETTETLYLLGCGNAVVGISGFTMRPPEARSKPKVSTFTEANFEKIISLRPDIVLTFSDVQADITRELMLRGIQVVGFNQRCVGEILQNILIIGSLVGKNNKAEDLVATFEQNLETVKKAADTHSRRPRVYFEEWYDPLITCIRWVSELVEIAGGTDVFADRSTSQSAKGRIVSSEDVIVRNPEIIIGSWCGKQFKPDQLYRRQGWDQITAIAGRRLFEVKSTIILQPGPAALTDGLKELSRIIRSEVLTE